MPARRADVPGLAPPVQPLVTCEHGGNRVPRRYRPLFEGHEALLATHRGYDPGALTVARSLARALDAPLVASTTSRLLVELNRSPGHAQLFSEITQRASREEREAILARHYLPYRTRVERLVGEALAQGRRVIHLSSHSFTPVLGDVVRNADVGLLYDPAREAERELCLRWAAALARAAPHWKVRRNYPYTGTSDGLCTWLRRHFAPGCYAGIELEINQRFVLAGGPEWRALRRAVVAALVEALAAQ